MQPSYRTYDSNDVEDIPVRIIVAADGRASHALAQELPCALGPVEFGPLKTIEGATFNDTDILCAVMAEEGADFAATSAQLARARAAGALVMVVAPPRLHQALAQQVDCLGTWPVQRAVPDVIIERRLRRTATDLMSSLSAISQLITEQGLACVDYADIRCILHRGGTLAVATGAGYGSGRVSQVLAEVQGKLAAQGIAAGDGYRAIAALTSKGDCSLAEFDAVMLALRARLGAETLLVGGLRDHSRSDPSLRLHLLVTGAEKPVSEGRSPISEHAADAFLDVPALLSRMVR